MQLLLFHFNRTLHSHWFFLSLASNLESSVHVLTQRRVGKYLGFAFNIESARDAWVAQSVKRPTPAQVMISQFVNLSPALGSVLTARSLEPASDSVSPSLSAPTRLMLCLSKMNKR